MAKLEEIKIAVKHLVKNGTERKNITLLQCNTEYPTPFKDLNLNTIPILKKLKLDVGLSDHSEGIVAPIVAISCGAKIIEKHITLSKKMSGPDHKASLEPKEFLNMVKNIRIAEISLGSNEKKVSKSEKKNIKIVRKSIVAKQIYLREINLVFQT